MTPGSDPASPAALLPLLEALPALLERVVLGLQAGDLRRRPAGGGFAAVEQAWHLADLEVEGYGRRIERLLGEEAPRLADFEGDAVARARGYLDLVAAEGVLRFQRARAASLARLRDLPPAAWARPGQQDGVGPLVLGDLPRMMLGHDRSHAGELAALLAEVAPGHPALPDLRALAGAEVTGSGRAA
jgi:hypothetical protein